MKLIGSISYELETDAKTMGELYGITDERAKEITDDLEAQAKAKKTLIELYKHVLENYSGNEALYALMYIEFLHGYNEGREQGIREAVMGILGEEDLS